MPTDSDPKVRIALKLSSECADLNRAQTPDERRRAVVLNRRCADLWDELGSEELAISHRYDAQVHQAALEDKPAPSFNREALRRGLPAMILNSRQDPAAEPETPARDLHLDAMNMAAQTGRKYTDVRTQLMTSRPEMYGFSRNRASETGDTSSTAITLLHTNRAITDAVQAVLRENPAMSSDEARKVVKNRQPQLFRFDDAAADLSGGDALMLDRSQAVTDYQTSHRCNYETARNAVRRSRPELFGLVTA